MSPAGGREADALAFAIALVFLGGFLANGAPGMPSGKAGAHAADAADFLVSVHTDKAAYGTGETLKATVAVSSPVAMDATIRLWGIRPSLTTHIDIVKRVRLVKGGNSIVFEAVTPRCTSGCGGVYPGPYEVVAELTAANRIVSASTVITLVEG